MNNLILTLDLKDYLSDDESKKQKFIAGLKAALSETGFFFLKNHTVSNDLVSRSQADFKKFFTGLTEQQRLKYEYPNLNHQIGYTPMRVETGEFASIADEKHFFQVRDRDDTPFVSEIPDMEKSCKELFSAFKETAGYVLKAIAISLDLPEDYFDDKEGNTVMRSIHYPAGDNPLEDDGIATKGGNVAGMCASKHTDINVITLLLAKEPGLELWHQGSWKPILIEDPDTIIINCGDMLEHLTGGRYFSGLHRVVCRKNLERYSIPYFSHIKENESLIPLEHLGKSDLNKYPYKTAGEFLRKRLEDIGI